MQINDYGKIYRNEQEVLELLYQNPDLDVTKILLTDTDKITQFNIAAKNCDVQIQLTVDNPENLTVDEFDRKNQQNWFLTDEYKNFDILTWLYDQCKTTEEQTRVSEELELYVKHNMFDLLVYMKYLVDTFRKNNIVWGVGRGSSVASYCLYLIGIHKVNSIKYNLDIHEFLK